MKSAKQKLFAPPAFAFLTGILICFQNCAKVDFQSPEAVNAESVANVPFPPNGPTPPPETTSCSLDSNNAGACNLAQSFVGYLYIQPRSSLKDVSPAYANGSLVGATTAETYLSHPDWKATTSVNGKAVPYTIALSSIDSLNNSFSNGFVTQSGETIRVPDSNGSNTSVPNWFALDLFGTFHLDSNDAPGKYQFALISDDGSEILYKPTGGTSYVMLVDNQAPASSTSPAFIPGTQWIRMGCSSSTADGSKIVQLDMTAQTQVPLEVRYFNGPSGLSFRMMYRKVPAAGAKDAYCETDVAGNASDKPSVDLPSPILDPNQVSGWKIVGSANLGTSN